MKEFIDSQKFTSTTEVMDAIHFKIKEDHQIITKAAYVVIGITLEWNKDILGI